ncbi:unnamed protein product [Durusdinium trenchii]|uniref:DUF1479 domain-containing protein n=1 Tax=Durusdinium trenchii TaxID=1381693 RepID=A0ABP0SJ83_9DINO
MGAGGSAPSRAGGAAQEKEAGGTVSGGEAGGPATSSGSKESHEAEASGIASKRDAAGSAGKEAKRSKPDPAPQSGQKRGPETTLEALEVGDDVDRGLLACVLEERDEKDTEDRPTLHCLPIASYPEWIQLETIYGERTGEVLEEEKVKKGRAREMNKMEEHQVKVDMPMDEVKRRGLKIVRSRWIDARKALPDDDRGVRSRLVAQELNLGPRDDTFGGTPPLWVHRLIVSSAATKRKSDHGQKRIISRYDVSVAFFHAPSRGGIAVMPPKDMFDGANLWFLLKAMNGTREASKQWSLCIRNGLTPAGFLASAAADPKYAKQLVKDMGLEGAKGVETPASKETGKNERNVNEPLSDSGTREFRKQAGTALYLLDRYLAKYPTEIWKFDEQEMPKCFYTYSDLSFGEAEYYALTRAASAGLLLKNVLEEIRRETEMICLTDSSAAKGITARQGVGRVKHLSLKELWVQDMVAKKAFKVQKESTETNWADIGTKILDAARISRLVEMMPLKRGIIAASLLTLGKCQGPEEYDTDEDGSWPFWLYFLLTHLFALFGLIAFCMRAYESFTNRNRLKEVIDERLESEGEKDESDDNGTGTEIPGPTVAQEPAMSSLGMEVDEEPKTDSAESKTLLCGGVLGLRYGKNLGACSIFRSFQGWLSLSHAGEARGALLLAPILREATAYLLLRPFMEDVLPSSFCGANPGKVQDLFPEFHQLLIDCLVPIPDVQPGDTVWWHCDLIHAVEGVHGGQEDAAVFYIPAVPFCEKNAAYVKEQAKALQQGHTPPDFPSNQCEVDCNGRGTEEDLSDEGRKAMAFEV